METFVRNSAENERLKHLQTEVDALKVRMLGQVTAIQGLAQRQDELWFLVNQLLQGNQLGQKSKGKKPVIVQPPLRQGGKGRAPQMAPVSQIQHHNQQKSERRQFTRLSMTLSQILPQLLETKLVTLKEAPKFQNTTSPKYNPNARCAYHSDSPGHATEDCWALKNKIQDLIDEGALEFTQDGQAEFFYHPAKAHHLK